MRPMIVATVLGTALAAPAMTQVPNVQQLLQGLTTGNQSQDQALRDAFERGYQRGREDEARLQRPDRNRADRDSRERAYRRGGDDRDTYRGGREQDPSLGRQGGNYNPLHQDHRVHGRCRRASSGRWSRRGSPT